MARRALNCAQSCHCRLLIIDDLHFLRWRRTNGIEVSNHFKFIANEFPVTLLMIGVGLEAKGLFSEGDSYANAPLAQTGRRTKNDAASETARKELELALEARKITTKITRQRKPSAA